MSRKLKIVELLRNNSFLKWLREGESVDDEYWKNWQSESSENLALMKDAADMERGIPFRKQQLDPSQSQAGWNKIEARIKAEKRPSFTPHWQFMKLAVAVLVLAVVGIAINSYLQKAQWVTVKTAFGETKTILLPDNSEVILGANSELFYDKRLAKQKQRDIVLKGEAFFKVQRIESGTPFSVQLKDIYVEVLGTSFNVNAYSTNTVVSLVEGSLRLSKQKPENTATGEPDMSSILLEPKQTAWFDQEQQTFVLATGDTNHWTSWINKEWSFGNGTSLATIFEKIEATYGLKVVVRDTTILNKKLAGKVSIESPDILFQSLATLLDLKITQKGKQLIIE